MWHLPSPVYLSFEVQLLVLAGPSLTLCVMVYRPQKYNKSFIHEFVDLLRSFLSNYDRALITGDFNIHICYKDDLLAKDLLTQWVSGPTHFKGHHLDLVSSYGLDICISDIDNVGISISLSSLTLSYVKQNRI